MRPIPPPEELPDHVRPVMFQPPPGAENEVNALPGLVHVNEENEPFACEFMFELTKEEIQVLKHEPYITITMMVEAPPVFALQTTFPHDQRFATLEEHQHICTVNETHEQQRWWRCDNPTHDHKDKKIRECDECFQARNEQVLEDQEDETED